MIPNDNTKSADERFVTRWAAEMKALAADAGTTLPELMREMVAGEITEEDYWRQQLAEVGRITD